jgi:group II intron reverse transcriptase/maturase
MKAPVKAKSYEISKHEVYNAWKRVRANRGGAGIDNESIANFEAKLKENLYKLWNRMSSGTYFPKAVRRVEIPKKDGSKRPLGIPTVYDRIAQEVVRARMEPALESCFHEDSYGYRPGKSAIEALEVCRRRNWESDWVLDVDIQKFFDTIDHELLLKAVRKHCSEKWMVLYIERWLKAPVQYPDGKEEVLGKGTPQGGVISPLLANLYLHYAFDKWMEREYPSIKFERYADDVVIHCGSLLESQKIRESLQQRLEECKLSLHPEKTKVVYCRDSKRQGNYQNVSYTFLGYAFKPRKVQSRWSEKNFTGFLPAVSKEAKKQLLSKLREKQTRRWITSTIEEVAESLNPMLRGWFNYFNQFYSSALMKIVDNINSRLVKWARSKYGWNKLKAWEWLKLLKQKQPKLFAHWELLKISKDRIGRAV